MGHWDQDGENLFEIIMRVLIHSLPYFVTTFGFSFFSRSFGYLRFAVEDKTPLSKKLSKPKLNQNLSSTEFEVRLHSYSDIHPTTHPPGTHHVVVNWPGRVGQRHTVQLYTHRSVQVCTAYLSV